MKKRIASLLMAWMLCLTLLPTTALADGGHSHPICGASCSDGKHENVTFDTPLSDRYNTLQIGGVSQMGEGDYYVLPAGNYYLPDGATIDKPILIKGGEVNICLNGNMIQLNGSALIQEVFKVEGGTLNLTDCKGGGKVCHLQETCSGRGVTLDNDTAARVTFNMYGGTICENTHQLSGENAVYGGGVYVFSNGTFNMYGGKIYNNKAKTVGTGKVYGGGVYNSGTFNLLGGEISSNETVMGQNGSEAKGSGVYNCGTFNMKTGSVIKKNSVLGQSDSSVYGGGVYNSGSFTMNDGEISENESGAYIGSAYGGGVYNAGTFELENGKITGNIVRTWGSMPIYGAGVCNYKKFVMSDGEITNNKAETTQDKAYGGGIYYYYSGNTSDTTEINGGKITGNTANTAGGGISMENSRYFKLGGNPVIWDNKVNNKQNNVVTNIYQKLTRPLTDGAKVGITVKNFEEKDRMVEVDSTISGDMSKYFVSDDSGYSLYQKGTGIYRKVAHNHTWTYELVSGTTDTVKATCIADVGKCEYDGDGGTLKIKMKYSGYEYDGTKPKAELEANNWHGEAVADITIEYRKKLGDAWIDAGELKAVGDYLAMVTLEGGVHATTEFRIDKGSHGDMTAAVWAVAGESKSIDLENYMIESASASLGDVTVTDEQGVLDGTPSVEGTALKYKLKAAALKGQKAIISVLVQPKNYVEYKVATTVTVDKNYVGGTPGYTPITEDGKTLADANLSCEGRFKDVAGNVVDGRVEWLDDPSAVVEADQAYQWCFIPMSPGEYAHVYGTITPYVKRVAPTVNAPTPKSGLVYNGESQVLINKGRSSGGEMQYSLKSGEEYSTALPTAVNAGKYTVYYKVVGDEDYADVAEQSIEVIVKAQTPKGTPTYRKVTASGKTLADAELTAPEGWPTGRILWMNGEAGMSPATPVTKGTAYEWVFIPDASQNYTSTGGELVLWAASGGGGGGSASSAPTVTVPVSSDNGSVKVDAAVSGSIAAVKVSGAQLDKVLADGANTVTVDVSGVKNVDSIKLPAALLSKISEAKGSGLTAVLPTGSVTMDNRALASISKGRDVIVSVKSIPISQLTAEQKNAIGEQNSVAAVVDVEVLVGGVKQSDFGGGKLTISIPYTPKDGENSSDLTVLFIQSDGTVENKGGRYDAKTKCFVFETDHLSRYLLVNTSKAGSFTDVSAEDWYFEAVKWAAAQNITGGVGNNQFAPNLACTRAQIVTFLWRSAGCPEGTAAENHFTDIDSNAYYYKAVLWAVENNIANGMSDTVFSPNTACTRAQIVTFLWRSAGCPEMTAAENHFTDIDAGAYYYKAVLWAIENNITNGMSDTAFGPNTACTRAQIVTLLYRSAK